MLAGPWVTIRTFATQASESAAPTTVVSLGQTGPRIEVALDGGTTVGSGADPTSIVLTVWRKADEIIHKLGTITIALADIAQVVPQLFEFNASGAWVTASFVGGTTPRVNGTVRARVVFGS